MDRRTALAIYAEAGTGKTITALSWIYNALLDGRIDNALVICPASLVPSWKLSIEKMVQFEDYTEDDVELMKEAVTIVSYGRTWKRINHETHHRDGTTSVRKLNIIRETIDHPWGAVVVDECHGLGSHSSIQTKACLKISQLAKYRFIMSGTPDSGKYEKLYGQIRFLQYDRWPNYASFDREIVISHDNYGKPYRYDVEAAEGLKKSYGVVARLRDCYDMPSETETEIPCELREKKIYDDLRKGAIDGYGLTITTSGTLYQKCLQVVSGFLKVDDGVRKLRTSKLDALRTILEGTDGKVVVFCTYRESISQCADLVSSMKLSYYTFTGDTKLPLWQNFQKDRTRVFIAQYQCGGVGIDLYASSTMVFYEPTFSALLLEQAKARIMRKGQTEHCTYYYLTTPKTMETKTWKAVRSGMDVSRAMLDEWAKHEDE